jgi:hypothetical protein
LLEMCAECAHMWRTPTSLLPIQHLAKGYIFVLLTKVVPTKDFCLP